MEARRVSVVAKKTVVSTTPVRPGKTYQLSPLDHLMAGHVVRLVFYYAAEARVDGARLMQSLSETLSHYPPLTGRLAKADDGCWVVRCNDAGVRVVEARAGTSLGEWMATAGSEEEMELAHWEPMGHDPSIWSPFYIQITEFEDKGYAIGLSCTHMHADPLSASLFINAWSDIYRSAFIARPPFFHPAGLRARAAPNTSTSSASFLQSKPAAAVPSTPPPKLSSATFSFSDSAVRSCLSSAGDGSTPSDALVALFWSSIVRAKNGPVSTPATSWMTLCIDFRKRLHAQLPQGFYGNALHFSRVGAELEEGIPHVAKVLRGHVERMDEEEYWSAVDWAEERRRRGETEGIMMYGPELTFAVLDHVPAYAAAIEISSGGRPLHVTCRVDGVAGEGTVLVMPGPDESGMGRKVVITLPEDQTDEICRDQEILRHEPVLYFYNRK